MTLDVERIAERLLSYSRMCLVVGASASTSALGCVGVRSSIPRWSRSIVWDVGRRACVRIGIAISLP